MPGSTYWLNAPDYRALFTDMDAESAAQVTQKLRDQKVPYELVDGGRTVRVPEAQVDQLRIDLSSQGLPASGRIGFEIFRRSSEAFLGVLEKLSGYQVLADLSDFFLAFSGMFDGFKERSRAVMRMLAEPTTSFVLVAAPDPVSLGAADVFFARLERERLPVGGLIVNRVHEIRTDMKSSITGSRRGFTSSRGRQASSAFV